MKSKSKKLMVSVLAGSMIFSSFNFAAFADATKVWGIDQNAWSAKALNAAVSNGLLVGDQTGNIKAKDFITRAEVVAVINRSFGAEKGTAPAGMQEWYALDMGKGVEMGIINKADLRPSVQATREEVFAMLGYAMKVKGGTGSLAQFKDADKISAAYKDVLAGMAGAGYIKGSVDETGAKYLKPQSNISREEFAQVMYSTIAQYFGNGGVIENGNLMVREANSVIKDANITGDLIIGDGVGDGDITIEGSTIGGRVLVRGGGKNTINFLNSKAASINIAKPSGGVRVKSEGSTVPNTVVEDHTSDVLLNGTFDNVVVATGSELTVQAGEIKTISAEGNNAAVKVDGDAKIDAVKLDGDSVKLEVTSGAVASVAATGTNARIEAKEDATIAAVVVNGDGAVVHGSGDVKAVEVKAEGAGVFTANTAVEVDKNVKEATVGEEKVAGGEKAETKEEVKPPASVLEQPKAEEAPAGPPASSTETPSTSTPETTPPSTGGNTGSGSGSGSGSGGGLIGGGSDGGSDSGSTPSTPTVSVGSVEVENQYEFSFKAPTNITSIKLDGTTISINKNHIDEEHLILSRSNDCDVEVPHAHRSENTGNVTWTVYLEAYDNDNTIKLSTSPKKLVVSTDGHYDYENASDIKLIALSSVTIAGSKKPKVGDVLTASVAPKEAEGKVWYKWYVSDSADKDFEQIQLGSTIKWPYSTYTIEGKYFGKFIKVQACTDSYGSKFTGDVYSEVTGKVTSEAEELVIVAEDEKTYSNINDAYKAIKDLEDSNEKTDLLHRVGLLWTEIAQDTFEEIRFADTNWDEVITLAHFYEMALETEVDDDSFDSLKQSIESVTAIDLSNETESKFTISTGPFVYFIGLEELDISNTGVPNLGGLIDLTNMKKLDVSDNTLGNLGGIVNMTELEELNVSNTGITELNVMWNDDDATDKKPRFASLKKLIAQNNAYVSIGGLTEIAVRGDFSADGILWDLSNSTLSADTGNHITQIGNKFTDNNANNWKAPTLQSSQSQG